jgi:hypothetical protein
MNVERIDAARARDHIEMVERILAEAQPRLCSGGEYFVVWGIASAYVTLFVHLTNAGLVPGAAIWSTPLVLAAAILFSILRGWRTRSASVRTSLLQREFFNVLWLTLGLAFVCNIAIYRIFNGIAGAAVLYIGMHGNRRAQVAGILVVASLIVANFAAPGMAAYILAGGMLAGYGGFGVSELLARE